MKRINIITGHYGSGKTEFALNLAKQGTAEYPSSAIADLDIVNPYFRTKDAEKMLQECGITLLASDFASTNVDIPSLPASISSVFDIKNRFCVLDVGGDDDGAAVLGRYAPQIKQEDYDMFFVINTKRPLTSTPADIIDLIRQIETASGLCVTGLVNNTNLSVETTVADLVEGQKLVEEVSCKTGLPILYITGEKKILDALPASLQSIPKLYLSLNMNLPFMA